MRSVLILFALSVHLGSCETKSHSDKKESGVTSLSKNSLIPFADTLSENWIVIQSKVYNKPAVLILDNGTIPRQELILFKHYAAATGLIDTLQVMANEMKRIENMPAPLSVSGFNDTIQAEIHSNLFAPLQKMPDGILGKGFLTKYIITVDYPSRMLEITDSAGYEPPEGFTGVTMEPEGPFYKVNAQLFIQGKRFPESVFLDLGNSHDGFLFGLGFYKNNKSLLKMEGHTVKDSYSQFSRSKVAPVLVDSVVLQGQVIRVIPSSIETSSNAAYIPILFGNSVLRHFGTVIFDLGHSRIFIRKNG